MPVDRPENDKDLHVLRAPEPWRVETRFHLKQDIHRAQET